MVILTLFQISTLITGAASLFLGLFVYLSGEGGKPKSSFSWMLTSVFIGLWSIGLFGVVFSASVATTWFWQYVLDIGAICIPILFLNFVLYFTKKEKKIVTLQVSSLVAGTALIILNFTNIFEAGILPKANINYWANPGNSYFMFPLYFIFFLVISIFIIIKEYRAAEIISEEKELKYVLLVQIFGLFAGFTDFFPQLFNIYPLGNSFVILYVIFISYAALKSRLFDIKIIATELFTFVLWVLLSIKIFFSVNAQDLMLNALIFISVLLFGVLLIRGVLKESKQREKIEQMADDIEKAFELEKKAKEELEVLDNTKDQFLMTIQHHLRTPLTSMRGYADLMLDGTFGKMPKKIEAVVKKFEASTTSLIKMVNDFLDITQFQLGKQTVSLKDNVNLSQMLEEIVNDQKLEAGKKGIYLKLEKPESACVVKADEFKLKAAIVNVFDNAVKYTKEGGVAIKLKIENEKARIEIRDTGMGIAKERLPKLFNSAFERVEAVKKNFATGRGIGLYLSDQIIKAHNGKIWAESEGEGKGSTFYIEIPINK